MTCGAGGLIVTRHRRLYERAFAAHDLGMIRVNGRLNLPGPDALFERSVLIPIPSRLSRQQEAWAVSVIRRAVVR